MERRDFLRIAVGFAAGAAGAAALAASAQAAPLLPQPVVGNGPSPAGSDTHPAVTTGEEVDHLKPEQVRWHWRRRRHWHWHRRRHWRRW